MAPPAPPPIRRGPAPAILLLAMFAAGTGVGAASADEPSLAWSFPERHGARVMAEGVLELPTATLARNELDFYALELTVEVATDSGIYDRFGLRFDVRAGDDDTSPLRLAFERAWRPGAYRLTAAVRDLVGGRTVEIAERLAVPDVPQRPARIRRGRTADAPPPAASVSLLPLPDVVAGPARVSAHVVGPPGASLLFRLDGRDVLVKSSPPWSAEVGFGRDPEPHRLAVVLRDAAGHELARDALDVNAGSPRFAVRLSKPQPGRVEPGTRLPIDAEIEAPPDGSLAGVELLMGGRRVAELHGPPWRTETVVTSAEPTVVTLRARLGDGRVAEDAVLLNAPAGVDEIDVDAVELYVAMLDRAGRPVGDVAPGEVRVFENGVPQELSDFRQVGDLPVAVALVVDTSDSMERRLPAVSAAAEDFLRTVLRPHDRAALITFADRPRLGVGLTDDLPLLATRLRTLGTAGGTALNDGLAFALAELPGRGARAVVLLSDGRDVSSRLADDELFELARRAGVPIYPIGIAGEGPSLSRTALRRIAEATGGRDFEVDEPGQLAEVFGTIEREVRSRYLVTYTSRSQDMAAFRTVDVEVARRGVEPRTVRGYYP